MQSQILTSYSYSDKFTIMNETRTITFKISFDQPDEEISCIEDKDW